MGGFLPSGRVRRLAVVLTALAAAIGLAAFGGVALAEEGASPVVPAMSPPYQPGWIGVDRFENIDGSFWWDGGVSVEISDGSGGQVLWSDPSVPTPDGQFSLNGGLLGFVLQPGYQITVSDGWSTRVLLLVAFGVDSVDYGLDRVYGHAPADQYVHVVFGTDEGSWFVSATADSGGQWMADFSGIADIPDNLSGGYVVGQIFDSDGDFQLMDFLGGCPSCPPPAHGTRGELEASFHAGPSVASILGEHSSQAATLAAPSTNPPGRIRPMIEGQAFCSDTPLGIWVYWIGDDRAGLDTIIDEFTLDGVPLVEQQVLKKFPGGTPGYWLADGVPVVGALPVGAHTFSWSYIQPAYGIDEWQSESHHFSVVDCG